mgnify:FL=1
MALVVYDRVQETTTTTGTGSVTLLGAVTGYQTFAVVGNGNTTFYCISDQGGSNWEVGIGTYSTVGPTLARTTVLSSSNSNNLVVFGVGTKSVFVTYPAGKSVNLDASGNVTALGTITSGVWNGTTVPVAYGGTGVTTSSGANSVVLRDANQNITVNRLSQGTQTITASGGTTTLTAASQFSQVLNGTGGQTFKLPDATTLTNTTTFEFNNNATGTLTITDNAGATVGTITSGGAAAIALLSNATVGGTWDVHAYIPENVTWGTNSLALGSTIITGGTWNGGTIASGYGGTGLTTFTAANYALYSTSASALTAGTLPVAAGGSGATTFTSNGVIYGSGTAALGVTAAGTTGQVLVGNTGAAPSWATVSSSLVSSFSAGTTGFTPSSATTGAVTLAGTLATTNGGTGLTSFTSGGAVYATSTSALTTGTLPVTAGGTGVTTSTGSGSNVLNTSPTLVTPLLGTPTSGTLTNCTGLPLTTGVTGTLPVANGGTGATSLTANNVILGNGTSAVQFVAPGTSGNLLTSNGTTWTSAAASFAAADQALFLATMMG